MRLAKWGYGELLLMLLTSLAVGSVLWHAHPSHWASLAPLPLLLVGIWFFRDPERTIPDGDELVVSPADGKVVDIEQVDEPHYIGGPALRVGIFLSPLDVHVNRAPVQGTVEFRHYRPGRFLTAYHPNAHRENECTALGIRMGAVLPRGGPKARATWPILVKQIAGIVARRIVCAAEVGDRIEKGERFGMIKFGSRTELYIPVAAGLELAVKVGDRVKGGQTVVGRLP